MKKGNTLLGFVVITFLTFIFFSCHNTSKNENNEKIETIITEEAFIGVQQLINEATRYNTLYGEEARQSLSERNPMPNVKQDVDTTNRMYVFEYIWFEDLQDMDKLNHAGGMRAVLQEMSSSPQSFNFMKLLVQEGYGIRFNVEGSKSGKKVSNEVSAQEVKDLVDITK